MAQVFTYSFNAVYPLYSPHADEDNAGTCMFELDLTGPASSVSDGMTISGITADLTYITSMWEAGNGGTGYKFRFLPTATTNLASTAKIVVTDLTDGAVLTGETNLSAVTVRMVGIGSGPLASAVD